MDSDNLYKIGVAGTVVVLLAAAWFLVYKPITELSEAQAALERQTTSLRNKSGQGTARRASGDAGAEAEPFYLPTAELHERLERQQEVDTKDLESAKQFYDEKAKRFSSYFDSLPSWTQGLAFFQSRFNDEIGRLQTEYRQRFEIAPEALQVSAAPPAYDAEIPLAMREYWMTAEVFAALEELAIAGLQAITFPSSRDTPDTQRKYHAAMPIQFDVVMPVSKLENLVTRLLSSDRVPFVLENLELRKTPEMIDPFAQPEFPLVREMSYPNRAIAEDPSQKSEALFPEPGVLVTIKLRGIYWEGIPEAPAEPR